jgi:DNA-binding XRE family transcriptional regulator
MVMSETSVLGSEVRRVRDLLHLSQKDLAKAAGTSRQTIGNLESGATDTTAFVLSAVLGALGGEAHRQSVDNAQLRVLSDSLLQMMGLPPIRAYEPDRGGGADVGETRVEFDRALVRNFGGGMGAALARLALNWEHLPQGQGVVAERFVDVMADLAAEAAAMQRRRPLTRVAERHAPYAQ